MAGGGVVVVSGRGLSTGDYRGGLTVYVVMVSWDTGQPGILCRLL